MTVAYAPARLDSRARRAAAYGITVATVVAGIAAATGIAGGGTRTATTAIAVGTVIAGCSFTVAGAVALLRRAEKRTGVLMAAAGFLLLAGSLQQAHDALPFTIGLAVALAPAAVVAHLALAFPDGRLHSRLEQILVVLAYLDVTVLQLAMLMFMGSDRFSGCPCPDNLLLVDDNDSIHSTVMGLQRTLSIALTVAALFLVVRRWSRASTPLRRAIAPVIAAGAVWISLGGLTLVSAGISTRATNDLSAAEQFAFAVVPIGFGYGLVRARLARASVSDLMLELGRLDTPGGLRDALARALGDSSVEIAYWRPTSASYVDADGRPLVVAPSAGRAVTPLERGGERVAALIHDPALNENAHLLSAVSAAAGLALENERLQAELRAQLDELRASRARIVEAGDEARRRLERNLHDGAQQRLVTVAVALGLIEQRLDDPAGAATLISSAREEFAAALEELRELARGLHPAILNRGLAAAVKTVVERSPVPVTLEISVTDEPPLNVAATAYYVASEALTNVARYSQASSANVTVAARGGWVDIEVADDGVGGASIARGSGLEGLRDRVEATSGRLDLDSPLGQGTRLRARLPFSPDLRD